MRSRGIAASGWPYSSRTNVPPSSWRSCPAESDADATPAKPTRTTGFDGGIHGAALAPAETHGEWSARIIRREVAVPPDWPWPNT